MLRFSLCLSVGLCCLLVLLHGSLSKEVELGSEWTLLGENDTVPKGAHIRMDLSTGEKWAKLVDEDDKETAQQEASIDAATGSISTSTTSAISSVTSPKDNIEQEEPDYDFEMMHRTLSKLPPEEQERIGGIPELPSSNHDDTIDSSVRAEFEERMKQIWKTRQAQLMSLKDDALADLPQILKDRIVSLRDYLENPAAHWSKIDLDQDVNQEVITNTLEVLVDLEYQLSDLDMARDFYTLGGWPLLVTLLNDSSHLVNQTSLDELDKQKIHALQAHACWTIGTMVKNAPEFYPYATESVSIHHGSKEETAISLVTNFFKMDIPEPLQQKALYALGSMLRGNRAAQVYFVQMQGPDVLANLASLHSSTKVLKRILALSHDVVSDVVLHPQSLKNDELVLGAWTTTKWCDTVWQSLPSGVSHLDETALQTVQVLAPYCHWNLDKAREKFETMMDQDAAPALKAIEESSSRQ